MIKIEFKDNLFNIAVNRFLFYTATIYFISIEWFLNFSNYPKSLYLPQGIFFIFKEPFVFSENLIIFLKILWLLSGILAAFNFLYRFSSTVFFIITFAAFNIAHNYGYHTHTYMPLVLSAAVMAFGQENRIFLIRFIFCSIFFMAGFSKIRNSGLEWVLSENLQNVLLRSQIYYHDIHHFAQQFGLNLIIAKNLMLTQIIAFLALALELLSPMALLKNAFSKYLVIGLLLMQVGIYFTIFVNFKIYVLLYIFWIDWHLVHKKMHAVIDLFKRRYSDYKKVSGK